MFKREADMTATVVNWMRANGLLPKAEFITPWGICDLVGVKFNSAKVARRLELRQTKPVTSIVRAALLLMIPDVEKRESTNIPNLVRACGSVIPEETVVREVERLVREQFVVRSGSSRLQKLNGWVPLHERLVAVELKISKVAEALGQARNNLGFADESFVGLPAALARGVEANALRRADFVAAGVGLLGVTHSCCELLIPAQSNRIVSDEALQLYCVEKFWRSRVISS
jgi:hypothetical protein